ncbi:MAG: LCP family protein [Oscillospiraceae bacterium]|nr:LCP family protein [Oscillospiraceae bacterium]
MGNRRYKNETTSRLEKALGALTIVLSSVAFLMVGAYGFLLWYIEPPEVDRPQVVRPPIAAHTPTHTGGASGGDSITLPSLGEDGWRRDVYTILIAGEDDGFGGNDVIMVVLFDVGRGSMDVLSIPRDTIVNVPWGLKKINSVQHLYRQLPGNYDRYIYALSGVVERMVGFPIDHWVTLDLYGFVALVDAIGGVYFDVPRRMFYSDPEQGLLINLHPGYQRLDGASAEGLVRFRNYAEGDIQRIRVQHDFLRALSSQLLQARNILVLDDLVRIFRDNVETDLTLRNLLWFATEFLQMDSANIRFHSVDSTMANINDHVNGISYVSLFVEPWLELLNTYMNPFTWPIEAEHLEILTRDPRTGQFFTTNGAPFANNWVR